MNPQHELKCKEIAELTERFLPLDEFGFQKSEIFTMPSAVIIYESESCRVQLTWTGWDMYTGDTISIYYGRDRTTIDESIVDVNGDVYYQWYDINLVLNFLDGISPQEAFEQYGHWPRVAAQFQQSEIAKNSSSYQPEWLIRMHTAIWNHYGQRLFDVFDSRNTDLWDAYTQFAREYREIKASKRKSDLSN